MQRGQHGVPTLADGRGGRAKVTGPRGCADEIQGALLQRAGYEEIGDDLNRPQSLRAHKERDPSVNCFAVHPDHPIQGGGFKNRPSLTHLRGVPLDGRVEVTGAMARATARQLASREGTFAGYSAAALHRLRTDLPGATIAVVVPDSGLKYLSTDLW